jgi:signal transduction histidine kinase
VNPLHSVRGRLSLALAVVLAAALGLVDLIVVPSLEHSLIDSKLSQLRKSAVEVAKQIGRPDDALNLSSRLQVAAATANARVAVLSPLTPDVVGVFDDSNIVQSGDLQDDPIAVRALRTLSLESGTVRRGDARFAEVAVPLPSRVGPGNYALLLTASLHDTLANVDQVRRRILIAGAIALVAALVVGYAAAAMFARRLRRLERAADRLAGGDFSEPIADEGSDEVGQLAEAFERMRQRLAQLEHARREFIANASHELRTPLFSLGGFLELMENEDLDQRTQRDFMATMREQIDRLTKLATELLDL